AGASTGLLCPVAVGRGNRGGAHGTRPRPPTHRLRPRRHRPCRAPPCGPWRRTGGAHHIGVLFGRPWRGLPEGHVVTGHRLRRLLSHQPPPGLRYPLRAAGLAGGSAARAGAARGIGCGPAVERSPALLHVSPHVARPLHP
ncbi:MAG: hypothetical protein ACK55I_34965, partial [bacterium]